MEHGMALWNGVERGKKRAMCDKGGYKHDVACGIEPSSP